MPKSSEDSAPIVSSDGEPADVVLINAINRAISQLKRNKRTYDRVAAHLGDVSYSLRRIADAFDAAIPQSVEEEDSTS